MAAPSRRTLGDLAGTGVNLHPRQVAMLEGDGCAIVCWNVPDPMSFPLEGHGALMQWNERKERLDAIQVPLPLEYSSSFDGIDYIETEWPSLTGMADMPGTYESWNEEVSSFSIFDCWPITPEQHDRFRALLNKAWHTSQMEQVISFCQDINNGEDNEATLLHRYHPDILDSEGNLTADVEDVTPKLHFELGTDDDLYTIWSLCRESSRRAWRAMELALPLSKRPALQRLQREVQPWY